LFFAISTIKRLFFVCTEKLLTAEYAEKSAEFAEKYFAITQCTLIHKNCQLRNLGAVFA
jgi:hypothetical protein